MIKYYCDWCGREIDGKSTESQKRCLRIIDTNDRRTTYDLCLVCYDGFLARMKHWRNELKGRQHE